MTSGSFLSGFAMEPSLTDLLLPGLKLMLIGMGIVFLFLALLVWVIGFTARMVSLFNPGVQQNKRSSLQVEAEEAELVAVVAAALQRRKG
mgnify:CR=1 FL=1